MIPLPWADSMARASVRTQPAARSAGWGMPPIDWARLPPSTSSSDEERPAVLLADVVDLDDVGVLEPRDGLGLGAEAGRLGRPGVAARQDHLERDLAIEADVPRPVDHAHPAAAELLQDLVAGQDRARTGRDRVALPGRPPDGRTRVGQVEQAPRLQRPMHLEEGGEPLGEGGEPPRVVFPVRRLTQLLAQEDLAVDELERPLGVAEQPGISLEEVLDRDPVARHPAPALLDPQLVDQLGQGPFVGHRLRRSLRVSPRRMNKSTCVSG